MNLNHLITPCKLPAYLTQQPTTKPITNITNIEYLQVLKSIKVLFITSNQQGPFTFARN